MTCTNACAVFGDHDSVPSAAGDGLATPQYGRQHAEPKRSTINLTDQAPPKRPCSSKKIRTAKRSSLSHHKIRRSFFHYTESTSTAMTTRDSAVCQHEQDIHNSNRCRALMSDTINVRTWLCLYKIRLSECIRSKSKSYRSQHPF